MGSGAGPLPCRVIVAEYKLIPPQFGVVIMAGLESTLKVENGLVEPSPESYAREGTRETS
jgi:hypothetical protein